MKGEMVQILQLADNKPARTVTPYIDSDKVIEILNERRVDKDTPFVVVSIIGTLRSGKSFLASALLCFLEYLEKNPNAEFDGWFKQSVEMSGVKWKRSEKSVTRGIWMWNRPFILTERDQKIGVLVLDCQGLHDRQFPSEAVDSLLTLTALSLSKIHIVNMMGVTRTTDFDNLENCIRYYQTSQQTTMTTGIFNTLVLAHRDWTCDDILGERERASDDENGDQDETVNPFKSLIAFKKVIEFMIPEPGPKIKKGSEEQHLLLSDMLSEPETREFFKLVSELFVLLFVKLPQDENMPSVSTSRNELISIVNKLKSNYGNGEAEFRLGSKGEIYEQVAILSVKDVIKQIKVPEVDAAIIIRHLNSEEELLSMLSNKKKEIELFINQQKRDIKVTSIVTRTPEKVAMVEKLWKLVESKADLLFSALQKRKIEELKEYQNKTGNKIWKMVVPTVVSLTAVGIATGGAGAVVLGAPTMLSAVAGGSATAFVSSVTATGMMLFDKRKEKEEIVSEKSKLKIE